MTIKVGEKLPEATFKMQTGDGLAEVTLAELTAGKKVVLIGMPGAFTGTCSNTHIPGFLEHLDTLKAKGVDTIAVVSVNDHFVMHAWAEATKADAKLVFIPDFDASFTSAIGLDIDLTAGGLGVRSKRYAIIAEDGVVTSVETEDNPGVVDVSGAAAVIDRLGD